MSTSSMMEPFVISGEEQIIKFLEAWEASENDPPIPSPKNARHLTDPDEINEFVKRLKKKWNQET